MKVIAAYLLLNLGGNTSPTADDIKKLLSSVGAKAEDYKIELLLSQLEGKDLPEVIAAGREKFASVPSCGGGGGGGFAVAASPAAGVGAAAPAADDDEKEENVELKEESDDDMIFSLFDD